MNQLDRFLTHLYPETTPRECRVMSSQLPLRPTSGTIAKQFIVCLSPGPQLCRMIINILSAPMHMLDDVIIQEVDIFLLLFLH